MKLASIALYLCLFLGAIFIGYLLGQRLSRNQELVAVSNLPARQSLPADQVNFLIFHVNKLKNHPELRVIWLAAFKPDAGLKVVPVYPTSTLLSTQEQQIKNSFYLTNTDRTWKPGSELLNILSAKGIAWNGTIILDDKAYLTLVDLSQKIKGSQVPDDEEPDSKYENGSLELRKAWQELCWTFMKSPGLIISSEDAIKDHYVIETETENVLKNWEFLVNKGEMPSCEFPVPLPASQ
jgi:hypothetical protein